MGGVLALSACGKTPQSIMGPRSATRPNPLRPTNSDLVLNARDFGAIGDAATNDTAALNAAIASLGTDGGTLWLPAGVYLIDPSTSVKLRDNVTLLLDAGATLQAIPVAAGNYSIVTAVGARNVAVMGGAIVGERAAHLGTAGEWGMGIRIMGCSDVTLQDVRISACWGDGIYVGATGPGGESRNVSISRCTVTGNRRQGLSITGCIGATIDDCEFSDTHGTAPESGIDLEPNDRLRVADITIKNCLMAQNAGYGILMCGPTVSNVRVERSKSVENALAGAALIRGTSSCQVTGSHLEKNRQHGVLLDNASYNDVDGCVIRDNSFAHPSGFPNVLLTGGSTQNTFADNQYGSLRRLTQPSAADVVVTPDCSGNSIEPGVISSSTVGQRRP